MIEQAKALLDSLAITFDFPILEFIRNYLTNPFFDKVMPYITLFGEWGAFWIAVALILVLIPKTRKTGWSMGAAMLLAWIVYGLAPAGSIGAIFLAAGLFVLTMSGLGVAIANRSETMQQTMFVMFFFVMIFILMSGLITPVESMPAWAQWITRLLPPRYFVEIMRAVYLKGSLIGDLWSDYVLLAVFAAAFNTLAAATYRKRA